LTRLRSPRQGIVRRLPGPLARPDPSYHPGCTPAGSNQAGDLPLAPSSAECSPRNDFHDTAEAARTHNAFERHNRIAEPFEWSFTNQNLAEPLERLEHENPQASPRAIAARSRRYSRRGTT
jgi:hypothetical protein